MKLYEILGVKEDASDEEIEKSYKRLAHQYHPDKGGSREDWDQLSFAYSVLGNSSKRQLYDNFGKTELPKIEAEIQTVLLQGFRQAINNRATNVIEFVRQFIDQGRRQVTTQKEQVIKEIEDLRRRRDVVETTSEQNLFHMVLDQAIKARENLIQEAEIKLEVANGCHAVLDTYKLKESTLPTIRRPPPSKIYQHFFGIDAVDVQKMRRDFEDNMRNMSLNGIDFGLGDNDG